MPMNMWLELELSAHMPGLVQSSVASTRGRVRSEFKVGGAPGNSRSSRSTVVPSFVLTPNFAHYAAKEARH